MGQLRKVIKIFEKQLFDGSVKKALEEIEKDVNDYLKDRSSKDTKIHTTSTRFHFVVVVECTFDVVS
ncbi:hypothetical protein ACFL1Y_00760 [Patescibacteria group bacterium]